MNRPGAEGGYQESIGKEGLFFEKKLKEVSLAELTRGLARCRLIYNMIVAEDKYVNEGKHKRETRFKLKGNVKSDGSF